MISKKLKAVFLVSVIALIACAGLFLWEANTPIKNIVRSDASYLLEDTLANLEKKSELVIIATPEKEIYKEESIIEDNKGNRYSSFEEVFAKNVHQHDYYTMRSVKVNKVLKGSLDAKTTSIYEHAVVINKILYTYQDNTVLQKGKKYMLFLAKSPKGYSLMAIQGKMNLDGEDKDENNITQNIEQFKKVKAEALFKYRDDTKNP